MNARTLGTVVLAALLCGCGSSSKGEGDGGSDGKDGSSGTDNGGGGTVELNASLGIWLTQYPITKSTTFKEGPVSGFFMLKKDGDDLAGATVKINGTLIPEAPGQFQSPGSYDPAYAADIPIAPGGTMTITVDENGHHHEFSFVCPAEVTITEPAENTSVSVNDQITVRWTGTIKYQNSVYDPILNLFEYDPDTGTNISLLGFDPGPYHLNENDTSLTLTLPDTSRPQYFVELSIPGDLTQNDTAMGYCGLRRRVHLVRQ